MEMNETNSGQVGAQRVAKFRELFDLVSQDRAMEAKLRKALDELCASSNDHYQREKIRGAIHWAEIYFSPRRWEKWGDRSRVKAFVLADIYKAQMAEDSTPPQS